MKSFATEPAASTAARPSAPRTVFLDFDGGGQIYRNRELGVEIPACFMPSGISVARRKSIVAELNRRAGNGVRFAIGKSAAAQNVHIGGTSAFDRLGSFIGLAEGIGSGDAFVMLDTSASNAKIISAIRHEAGHITGTLDHGGRGIMRYAWKHEFYNYFGAGYSLSDPDYKVYLRRKTTTNISYKLLTVTTVTEDTDSLSLGMASDGVKEEYRYSCYYSPWYSRPDTDYVTENSVHEIYHIATGIYVRNLNVYGGIANDCTAFYMYVSGTSDHDTYEKDSRDLKEGYIYQTGNYQYYQGYAGNCTVSDHLVVSGNAVARSCTAGNISVSGDLATVSDNGVDEAEYRLMNGVVENCTVDGGALWVGYGGIANGVVVKTGKANVGFNDNIAKYGSREGEDSKIELLGTAQANNLLVKDGYVSVNYGGELHGANINGTLYATYGAVLGGVITCKAVDIYDVTPQTNITIKLDLNDYAEFCEKESKLDENGNGTITYYYANYTTKVVRYEEWEEVSTTKGTFDNRDGRFDMRNWKYTFHANVGECDELALGNIVLDFGGTERDFDSGTINFSYPTTTRSLPFTLRGNQNKWREEWASDYYWWKDSEEDYYTGQITYNAALYGEAAEVLYLDHGDDDNAEYYVSLPSEVMGGATEDLTITDKSTGDEVLPTAKIRGNQLVIKGGTESANLTISAEDSGNRDHNCDLELLVVPEEIPVIGKAGAKRYSEMLKKAQQNRVTKMTDILPYNIHTKLFGMDLDLSSINITLTIDWDAPSMELKLQGKLEWKLNPSASGNSRLVIDLSGSNYISISHKKDKFDWDLVGELKVPDFKLGKFEFSNMSLSVNKGKSSFSASAYVKLPWINYAFGGSIGIVDGYLDSMAIGVGELNVPLGQTGLFLQKIEGSVNGIATELNLTFEGTLGLTAGPSFTVDYVDWLGIDSGTYSLAEITLTGSITTNGNLKGTSSVSVLGGFVTGGGSAGISGGELFATGNYTLLNGCISIDGEMRASTGGLSFSGKGTVSVPRERVFGPLAGMGMSANVTASVTKSRSSSYIMAWQNISLFGNEFSIGFKCDLNGRVFLLGSADLLGKTELPVKSKSIGGYSLTSLAASSEPVAVRGAGAPAASEVYTVTDQGVSLFQFSLDDPANTSVSLSYGGTEYIQAEIAAGAYENMQIVGNLADSGTVTIAVNNANLGDWSLNAYGSENVAFSAYTVVGGASAPVITAVEVGDSARSATIRYTFGDYSALENATFSIFRAEAGSDNNGVKLAEFSVAEATGSYEYVMNEDAAGGDYVFRVMIASDNYAPAIATSAVCALRGLDTEAPDQIQTVNVAWSADETVISWEAPYDDTGVAGYRVKYRAADGEEYSEVDVESASFAFSGLPCSTYYCSVAAFDEAGNLGAFSEEVEVLVLNTADAQYKNVTLTEDLHLKEYEAALNLNAASATVTADANSLIYGSTLGNAEIAGIVENSTLAGAVSVVGGGVARDLTVSDTGTLTLAGTWLFPEEESSTEEDATSSTDTELVYSTAEGITVASGGTLILKDGVNFSGITLDYGTGLVITKDDTGKAAGRFLLTDDIRTGGRLSTHRLVDGNGHKIILEQYKQGAEFNSKTSVDDVAFVFDMDKFAGDVLEIEIDSNVYGNFRIADQAKYFNTAITVRDHADKSSAAVGFDGYTLVGNALCKLWKDEEILYLETVRSALDAPTVTVDFAADDRYSYLTFNSDMDVYYTVVHYTTFRYSPNADMSEAIVVTADEYWESTSLDKVNFVDNATYYVQASVEDYYGAKSGWSTPVAFTVVPKALPNAPNAPSVSGIHSSTEENVTFTVSAVDEFSVYGYRFRYADNPEMTNAVTIETDWRYANYASVARSEFTEGVDYYVQAGVKIGSEWSYWSDITVFNTMGYDYDTITIGPDSGYNYFSLNGQSAHNVTVAEGGYFYGGGRVDTLTVNGGFFRDDGAAVTDAVVNSGEYWLYSGSVSDIVVNGGSLQLMNGSLNGAVIGVDGVMELDGSWQPTITGTILLKGTMNVYNYHPGVSTGAGFVFDLGAHEADKSKMFITYTDPLLGDRSYTVKLDDTPETGDYRLTHTPNSGELYIGLQDNADNQLGVLSLGGEAILHNQLYYSLIDHGGAIYLHVSDHESADFIGKVKLAKNTVVYDSDDSYSDLAVGSARDCDYVLVESGGSVYNVTVGSGGEVDVYMNIFGATVESGGQITLYSGALAQHQSINIQKGGNVTIEGGRVDAGAVFNIAGTLTLNGSLQSYETRNNNDWEATRRWFRFRLDELTAPNDDVMVSDYTQLQCNPEFSVTISADQANGEYKLLGNAAGFAKYVSIGYDGGNNFPDYLYVDSSLRADGKRYDLSVKDDVLVLTVGGGSSGSDNELSGELGYDGVYQADFTPVLECSGLYTVVGEFGGLNGSVAIMNGKKSVATGTIKNGALTFNKGKGVLLDSSQDYTVVIKNTDKGKSASEYTLALEAVSLFDKGDSSDDWADLKTSGATGAVGSIGKVEAGSTEILSGWVGYGDATDYKAFTLGNAARLSLDLSATDAAKFTINQLVAKTDKKGVTTYSLKSLQTATVKAGAAVTTKGLLLDAGTYYLGVQSTNAAKGGSADYTVQLNSGAEFFTNGDNSDDAWASAPTLSGGETISGNWVGYGDAVDYRNLTIDENGGFYSFELSGVENKVKLTVYSVTAKTGKNGATTYSLKSVKSATATAKKPNVSLANLCLNGGTRYVVAVEAPGAKKAQNSTYDLAMAENATFKFDNNDWESAELLGNDGALGVLTSARGGDKVDYYDLSEVENLLLDVTAGKVKVSFFDENKKAVKVSELTMADGTLKGNVASLALASGNGKTDHIAMAAIDEAVKYLKVEGATSGCNTYTFGLIA